MSSNNPLLSMASNLTAKYLDLLRGIEMACLKSIIEKGTINHQGPVQSSKLRTLHVLTINQLTCQPDRKRTYLHQL
jgi:hypothetical protein